MRTSAHFGYIFNFNSDLSGEVIISRGVAGDMLATEAVSRVSGEALLAFVAEYVRRRRQAALEDASVGELLGLPKDED